MVAALSWPNSLASSSAMDSVDSSVPYRSKAITVLSDVMFHENGRSMGQNSQVNQSMINTSQAV